MRLVLLLLVVLTAGAPPATAAAEFEEAILTVFVYYGVKMDDDELIAVERKPNYVRHNVEMTLTTGEPGYYEVLTDGCTAVTREVATIDSEPTLQREQRIDVKRALSLIERDGGEFIWTAGVYGSLRHRFRKQPFAEAELRSLAGASGSPRRITAAQQAEFRQSSALYRMKELFCR
jgi:hypothetical protein